jgi:hypothetical protein
LKFVSVALLYRNVIDIMLKRSKIGIFMVKINGEENIMTSYISLGQRTKGKMFKKHLCKEKAFHVLC